MSLMQEFNQYFDENIDEVTIFSPCEDGIMQYTFSAAEVLQKMAPDSYKEEFQTWLKTKELV
jgi:hypothetical protein